MIEFELEKPYSTQEVASVLGISYGTFRNSRKSYEEKLSKGYKWSFVKRRYIFHEKIGDIYKLKSEELYSEVYLPKVMEYIGTEKWDTATGTTLAIYNNDIIDNVNHLMSTAYTYVRKALGDKYDITEKKYATCEGPGTYPRFMTDEEVKAWNDLKSQKSFRIGQEAMELAEQRAMGFIKQKEFEDKMVKIAGSGFVSALGEWIMTYGYIPVLINHYELKNPGAFEIEG